MYHNNLIGKAVIFSMGANCVGITTHGEDVHFEYKAFNCLNLDAIKAIMCEVNNGKNYFHRFLRLFT